MMKALEIVAADRWNLLSYEAAVRALLASGHAAGHAGSTWGDLPQEVQRDLLALWTKKREA
jgi:hypothetical protein